LADLEESFEEMPKVNSEEIALGWTGEKVEEEEMGEARATRCAK
jgi:hypothetical protein